MITMTIEETATEIYARELGEARELLAKALAERGGEHVYQRQEGATDCMYLTYEELDPEGGPLYEQAACPTGAACIVGYVLVEKGVDMLRIRELEGTGAKVAVEDLKAFTSEPVLDALQCAQNLQDSGNPWGAAVAAFEASIADYEERVAQHPGGTLGMKQWELYNPMGK